MNQATGKYIMLLGAIIIVIGIVVYFFHASLKWFGRLPGDISVEKGNFRFYFPLVTMIVVSLIVVSLLITLIINIIKKL